MSRVAYVFYSHSDYSDIWPIMLGQTNEYLKNQKKYIFTNTIGKYNFDGWQVVLYDDSQPYKERVVHCLEEIEEEIVIFHHEDMFLLSEPKFSVIDDLISKVSIGKYDLIKFGRAQYTNSEPEQLETNLFKNPSNLSFAIQPTIVSKKNISKIYRATFGDTIWKFESNSCNFVNFTNLKSCFYYEETDKKRGMYHWDSGIYPYIATAVVKGKWDYECYSIELSKLMDKYKIDPNVRGKNV